MELRLILALLVLTSGAYAWGNGFSIYGDPVFTDDVTMWTNAKMYGTHDYLAEKALEMLASESPGEAGWIATRYYYYGTELPDSLGYKESIGDRSAQILRFDPQGHLTDDKLATQSMRRYDMAVSALERGETATASKWAGAIMSYVSDAGLFSRVIEDPVNGKRYEDYTLLLTDITYPSEDFESLYGGYIEFDGSLEVISPYDAVVRLGQMTYLGEDGRCSAQWMDDNYDINDSEFIECAGRDFNNIVNTEADVLHTIYLAATSNRTYGPGAYDWSSYVYTAGRPAAETGGGEAEGTGAGEGGNATGIVESAGPTPSENQTAQPANAKPEPIVWEPGSPARRGGKHDGVIYALAWITLIVLAILFLWAYARKRPSIEKYMRDKPTAGKAAGRKTRAGKPKKRK